MVIAKRLESQIIQKDYGSKETVPIFFIGLNTWNGYHLTHGKKKKKKKRSKLLTFTDPTLFVYIVIHFCGSLVFFLGEPNQCRLFTVSLCLYLYFRLIFNFRKWRTIEIILTNLIPPHICACQTPAPAFSSAHVLVFLCAQ